ncbi:MAG: DUF3592 domain-containing protein [Clostridia bacterium]|nr:DUF3592 domain-containing protein [Clostridia bacterium]
MGKATYFKSPDDEDLIKEEQTQEEKEILEAEKRKTNLRKTIRGSIFPLILFILILGVGIFVIIYGAKPELFRDKSYVATQATVVKYEWRYSHDGGTLPYPVYKYTFEEKEYELESRTSVSPPPYEVGEVITIYVNPADPTDIITPIGNKFFIIFGIVALVIAFFGLCVAAIRPILEAAYPKSDWPKFITLYIPSMIFVWAGVVIVCTQLKSPSNGITSGFVLTLLLILMLSAFATFISIIMVKDMVETISLNANIAKSKKAVAASSAKTNGYGYQTSRPRKKKRKNKRR